MIETLRGTLMLARIAWKASKGRFLLSFLLMLLQFTAMPLAAPALAALTNAAIAHDASGVTGAAIAVAALAMAGLVAGHFGHVFYFELGERVQLALERDLIDLSNGSAGLEHHERPDYADKLRVVTQEVDWAGWSVMGTLFSAIGLGVGGVITAVLLGMLNPWLLLLPVFAIPSLVLGRRGEVVMGTAREDAAPFTRRVRHVFRLATDAGPAKELRACGLGDEMYRRQRDSWNDATRVLVRGEDRSAILQVAGQVFFAIAYIGATLLVIRDVVTHQGSVGDVVLVISLASQVNQQVTQSVFLLVGLQRISRTLTNLAWIRELVEKDLPVPDLDLPRTITRGIELRDVSFAYPGTERVVSAASTSSCPPGTRSPSSERTARARPPSSSSCAASTSRPTAPSRWTAWTCAGTSWTRGASGSPRGSRTSRGSSSSRARRSAWATCRRSTTATRWRRRSTAPGERIS